MTRITTVLLIGALAASFPGPGWTFWAWMHDAALTQFTDGDWDILKAETRRVLDDEPDGARTDWNNSETGNGGSIKALATLSLEAQPCRRVAFKNVTATGTEGQGVYHLCRQEDGTWKFVAEATIRAAGTSPVED